ncbi:MAG: hypothetical protein D6719_04005 [Candidatus Dadabacteria bacterium]|nr:MAG: hypothetical protein D6719_04005 [Candidatus Dadabacteria bacterium]
MIWSSNSFLEKCYQLKLKGYNPDFTPGMIIGRGFADFGFESFTVLPSDFIISLLTGDKSRLSSEERDNFFAVPDCDMLTEELLVRGASGLRMELTTEGWFSVSVEITGKGVLHARNNTLWEALFSLLMQVL